MASAVSDRQAGQPCYSAILFVITESGMNLFCLLIHGHNALLVRLSEIKEHVFVGTADEEKLQHMCRMFCVNKACVSRQGRRDEDTINCSLSYDAIVCTYIVFHTILPYIYFFHS